MTKEEAISVLYADSREDLAGWVECVYEDFYGVEAGSILNASKDELVEWILAHYKWVTDGYWISDTGGAA